MSEEQKIRVVIADDQELVCVGLATVIRPQPSMTVVTQTCNSAEAATLAKTLHLDMVLTGVCMPDMNSIETARQISSLQHRFTADRTQSEVIHTKVIILTTLDSDEYVMAAITAGVSGFLLRDTEPETLLSLICTVFRGNAIITPLVAKRLTEKMVKGDFVATDVDRPEDSATTSATDSTHTDPESDKLTGREREVSIETAHGLSSQGIADELFISLPTVETHMARTLSEVNACDRVQAMAFAYGNHLV